jgi:hypothetical protein
MMTTVSAVVPNRIVHQAQDSAIVLYQCERHRKQGQTRGEVAGAVEGIQTPAPPLRIGEALVLQGRAHFLTEQRDLGPMPLHSRPQCALHGRVRLGHQAAVGLYAVIDRAKAGQQLGTRAVAHKISQDFGIG